MPINQHQDDTWSQYRRLILAEIESIHENIEANSQLVKNIELKLNTIELKLNTLETKYNSAGAIFGLIAGLVSSVVVSLISNFLSK